LNRRRESGKLGNYATGTKARWQPARMIRRKPGYYPAQAGSDCGGIIECEATIVSMNWVGSDEKGNFQPVYVTSPSKPVNAEADKQFENHIAAHIGGGVVFRVLFYKMWWAPAQKRGWMVLQQARHHCNTRPKPI